MPNSLYLVEIVPNGDASATVDDVSDRATKAGAELIEVQVTAEQGRIFAIVEAADADQITNALEGVGTEVSEPAQVRLVGAELDQVKAARPDAGYLVEWDIPDHIDMDTYLTRKKANSPKYAEIPEVSFLRTYVREDMGKCLCFYDAPDTDAVLRARDIVSTPVDRLHVLEADIAERLAKRS